MAENPLLLRTPSDLASGGSMLRDGDLPNLGSPQGRTEVLGDLRGGCRRIQPPDGRDEIGTLRTLTAYRVIIDRLITSHRGRIFNTAGDSLVADFASAVDAVQCAVEVQDAIAGCTTGAISPKPAMAVGQPKPRREC